MTRAEATVKFLKSWREFRQQGRELKAERRRRQAEDREAAIQEMVGKIEAIELKLKEEKGSTKWLTFVKPDIGEDPEIVAEAWRRYEKQRDEHLAKIGEKGLKNGSLQN